MKQATAWPSRMGSTGFGWTVCWLMNGRISGGVGIPRWAFRASGSTGTTAVWLLPLATCTSGWTLLSLHVPTSDLETSACEGAFLTHGSRNHLGGAAAQIGKQAHAES